MAAARGPTKEWMAPSEILVLRGWAPGHLTMPVAHAGYGPRVVVLHDWFGLDAQARSVVDRLAAEGHPAFAPDLYHGRLADDADEAARLASHLESGDLTSELLGAVELVKALPGAAAEPIVVIGLGFSGALALYLASRHPDVRAVVCYDGFPPPEATFEWVGLPAAVLGHACQREFRRAGQVQATLRESGVDASFFVYPSVLHGFFDASRPDSHDREAAELSWRRTVRFLRERSGPRAHPAASPPDRHGVSGPTRRAEADDHPAGASSRAPR